MYLPSSEPWWRIPRQGLVLVLSLVMAGCAGNTMRESPDTGRDTAADEPSGAPATVQVDAGVGFTVTEAVRISSGTRSTYREALQRIAAADVAGGIELLEEVVEQAPEATAPYVDLGIAYGRAGRHEEAAKALEAAVLATPDHPVAHNELGIAYRRLGRFADARRSYERALKVFPEFHFARRNLAVLCDLYLADLGCARDHYEAYQAAVPDDEEVNMWLADLRNRTAVQAGEES